MGKQWLVGWLCVLPMWLGCSGLARTDPQVQYLNSGRVLRADLPFSEAVRVGKMLFVSGQIGVLPSTMQLVAGGIRAEAEQAIRNIQAVLEAQGYELKDVVKCTVMLADLSEWSAFNDVYRRFFHPPYPARSAFGARELALGARVELECIAAK